jgi:LysR family hydrogen peroxide-inducible transcriptional activator
MGDDPADGRRGLNSSLDFAGSIENTYICGMLPTLRQLQYLKFLAEHGSFGRAAEAAHVTQPTLSAGIQELERTLGAPVVDRARSGVILTAVGEEALRRATVILNEAEELVEAAKNAGQPLTGRFRLGVIPQAAAVPA